MTKLQFHNISFSIYEKMLLIAACTLFAAGAFVQTGTAKPAAKPMATTKVTTTAMMAKPAAATMSNKPTTTPVNKTSTATTTKSHATATNKPVVKHRKHKKAAAKHTMPAAPKQ